MPPVARPRPGQPLRVNGRRLPFSYFPVGRGGARKEVFDSLFATSPWAVMSGHISTKLQGEERSEALAFLEQGRQFYATAGSYASANPLLYYYAFLNLAKPLIRLRGFEGSLDRASHGLQPGRERTEGGGERLRVVAEGPRRPKDCAPPARGCAKQERVSVFAELGKRLYSLDQEGGAYDVGDLMSQVVIGHRLWRQAGGHRERFLGLHEVEMRDDPPRSSMWLRLLAKEEDLTRFGFAHRDVLDRSGLRDEFVEVRGEDVPAGCVAFEQVATVDYGQQANDHLDELVEGVRGLLWRIVSADPEQGYRKYYLHLSPAGEARLPQLLSMWMLLFHYGSMVRYRPHVYAEETRGEYGAFIQEFVAAQPEQMLYLFASELCEREIAKPAIA